MVKDKQNKPCCPEEIQKYAREATSHRNFPVSANRMPVAFAGIEYLPPPNAQ
jgi:hypothetical protein